MRLLSIVPIARGIRKETLTYFSSKNIEAGAIVTVPLRKKEVPGIVLESLDAIQNKGTIKEMGFGLKKIVDFDNEAHLPRFLMTAVEKIGDLSAASIGSTLAAIVPKICFENPKIFFKKELNKLALKPEGGFEILAIQLNNGDRMDTYRSLIRESFAKKRSIVIICPTIENVSQMKEQFSKGIAEYTFTLENTTSKKQLREFRQTLENETHPLLLIGTPTLLSLLNETVGTIILEEESSPFYKNKKRPFLDERIVSKEIARALNARLIYGDKLLSVQTLASIKEDKIAEYGRIEKRTARKVQTLLVDMKPREGEKKKFNVLSDDLKEMITYGVKNGKKILIYASRRGVASQTVCNDCGTTILCESCESPYVLHTLKNKRVYICHHCGHQKDAGENCTVCGGWNLVALGIGIEKIEEEIKTLVKDAKVTRIDSDNTKTSKDIKAKLKDFYAKGDILLTTDLGVRYIEDNTIDFVAITSLDSLLSLPDFRASERIMHIILDLKSKTKEMLLIQARNLTHRVIEQALSGDLEGFANDEIKARETFGYAPFAYPIKISIEGKNSLRDDADLVLTRLKDYSPVVFPAFIKSKKGYRILHILIRINQKDWPNKDLLHLLLSLPPHIKIDTSPTSLL